MKWMRTAISAQNLFLKLAIFITGIATAFDSSLRQLLAQCVLFLVYFLLQISLYKSVANAFRKILPFFAGYWLFSTLFGQLFPDTVRFSVQLIYLILVSVAVFAETPMSSLAFDSKGIRRYRYVAALFYYSFATQLYLQSFVAHYHALKPELQKDSYMEGLGHVFHSVSQDTERIGLQVRSILSSDGQRVVSAGMANELGIIFLALLVLVHGL
ncbi:MAG: hypothetical protein RBS43_05590 [Candidatus Cloacimonas sp.]|jgi:hypothetical protein|nr:hypothetical protein [Candidatus Cloacimonas sp.]